MTNTPLGDDELAGLLDELVESVSDAPFFASPDPVAAPRPATEDKAPKPFAFGQARVDGRERTTLLERMGEKLSRSLKAAVEPFARCHSTIAPQPIEIRSFGEWQAAVPYFTSVSLYWLRPLKGGMMLTVEPDFVAGLVESFYGGSGSQKRATKTSEFTASETLLLRRLLDKIVSALVGHWCEILPVDASLAARETNIAHVGFLRHDDPVVIQRLKIGAGSLETTLTIVYPLAMIRPIEARMASKVHDDEANRDDAWRLRLAEALEHVRLPVRSVLARPEVSVAELLALKPGDVIPITLAPRTPLLAGQRRIAEGMIGEQDGRAALMIESVGNAR